MIKLFWLGLSVACIAWYFVLLGLVAFKGGADIKEMLFNLSKDEDEQDVDSESK